MIYVKIYCGNLPYEVTDRDLRDLFQSAGCEVLEGHVFFDSNGRSRGFGAVRVAKADVDAATKLSETEFRGRRLVVRPWTESARFTQTHYRKA
jgi:RNA recognition motif-containing protein